MLRVVGVVSALVLAVAAEIDPGYNCFDWCYDMVADGYILVKNKGGYVARFSLSGKTVNKTKFCCGSGDFDHGQQQVIAVPLDSTDLVMTIEEEVFISIWNKVTVRNHATSGFVECWEISGTTLEPNYQEFECPTSVVEKYAKKSLISASQSQSNSGSSSEEEGLQDGEGLDKEELEGLVEKHKALYDATDMGDDHPSVGGQDACSSCFDDCSKYKHNCGGQVGMKNHGGFVAEMCVSGALSTGEQFCCRTDTYTEGKWGYIDLPCGSTHILVVGEEKCAANQWSTGGAATIASGDNTKKCYQISGSTLNVGWSEINC